MIDPRAVAAHRARALSPDHPVVRGTAQNPDVFFQNREAANKYYLAAPTIVQRTMDRFAALTGRAHRLFEYKGAPDAERVIVVMGSASETVRATVRAMGPAARVGVITVKLYRPFSVIDFLNALPATARRIAVLDRTKEPGAIGEPLYQDIATAISEWRLKPETVFDGRVVEPPDRDITLIGGRYGLGSKEFTPAMAKAVFDHLDAPRPKRHFTVGIADDVTGLSLAVNERFTVEPADSVRAVFFGLGADGTVGATKNSVKIIGEEAGRFAQGYFVYDSKKSGAITISHLRFGPAPIQAPYLISKASFVACHQYSFLDRYDILQYAEPNGVFLLNAPFGPDEVWDELPADAQEQIIEKRLRMFVIDAYEVARSSGMGTRINTIMQTCFFALSGVLPRDEAIAHIKHAIEKTYRKRGAAVVEKNNAAVDATLSHLHEVVVPDAVTASRRLPPAVASEAPHFVQRVTAVMLANHGDRLPVSAFPADGTWPTGTSQWEKRNIANEIPVWDAQLCIQCNKCALVCPHAAIRAKVYDAPLLSDAPPTFKHVPFKDIDLRGEYTIQVAPEDCTGCSVCVDVCPAKDKAHPERRALAMTFQAPLRDAERENYRFFIDLPEVDRTHIKNDVKHVQLLQPLFEYSGACAGCGETPYLKLLTQLFGDRMVIANATGCSSIYGGNLPTTPYATNREGRGPAWANSLFEDNAEFGLGIRLSIDQHVERARAEVRALRGHIDDALIDGLLNADQRTEAGIRAQRERVEQLKRLTPSAAAAADYLVEKSVWIVGGDGWAYDIGYGGLDHVLASGANVNVLVLDTEVYSNTGGQQSKATPLAATAKFAAAGKRSDKKDLGLIAMSYGNTYVAQIAMGAKDAQALKAFQEAAAYNGPSLIIAYGPCIAHGYDLSCSLSHQRLAVDTGYWPLYRFDPRRAADGLPPLAIDAGTARTDVAEFMKLESRFQTTAEHDPDHYSTLVEHARQHIDKRLAHYRELAATPSPRGGLS